MRFNIVGVILLVLAMSGCISTTSGKPKTPTKCYSCGDFRNKGECKKKSTTKAPKHNKRRIKKRAWHDVWEDEHFLQNFPKPTHKAKKRSSAQTHHKKAKKASSDDSLHNAQEL